MGTPPLKESDFQVTRPRDSFCQQEGFTVDRASSPFLKLPLELRRVVYDLLLRGSCFRINIGCMDCEKLHSDYFRFREHGGAPWYGDRSASHWENPEFRFMHGESRNYREPMGINPAILRTNRQIYEEAEPILYQVHDFNFDIDIFGAIPFLRSLSYTARQNMFSITMKLFVWDGSRRDEDAWAQEQIARENGDDWSKACSYIAENVRLREFAFDIHDEMQADFKDLTWVQDLLQIKGLQEISHFGEGWGRPDWTDAWVPGPDGHDLLKARWQTLLSFLRVKMLKP